MKIATASRFRMNHAELACTWFGVAMALIVLRIAVFGISMSPTLEVLLGVGDRDPLGPLAANKIALEDPLLILAAVVAAVIAAHHTFQYARERH